MVLIYTGTPEEQGKWMVADFMPYVYHLDASGKPDDRFFDGFLFLAQLLPGGRPTESNPMLPQADRDGWVWFLDRIFEKGKYLDALDQTVGAAPKDFPPAPPPGIAVMIPYASTLQRDFGAVNGERLDFDRPGDRIKAVSWYMDEFLARWNKAGLKRIRLAGFYWMNEGLNPGDKEIVSAAGQLVHDKGLKFFWIPYFFGDPNTPKWKDFGFDCAVKQPNYFFPNWNAEKNRVAKTARLARRQGMGVEIELDDTVMTQADAQEPKFLRYLDAGVEEGFMAEAFTAWYQQAKTLAKLQASPDPRFRKLYDWSYQFVKGTFRGSTAVEK